MKNDKRMYLSIFWVVLGGILFVSNLLGKVDEYWSGMGCALIIVGILQLIRHIKYRTNEKYREKMDVETKDERNKYLSLKAWAWAGYWFVMICAVGSIVLKILGQDELVMVTASGVCLIMVLYWINYLYLRKKY